MVADVEEAVNMLYEVSGSLAPHESDIVGARTTSQDNSTAEQTALPATDFEEDQMLAEAFLQSITDPASDRVESARDLAERSLLLPRLKHALQRSRALIARCASSLQVNDAAGDNFDLDHGYEECSPDNVQVSTFGSNVSVNSRRPGHPWTSASSSISFQQLW